MHNIFDIFLHMRAFLAEWLKFGILFMRSIIIILKKSCVLLLRSIALNSLWTDHRSGLINTKKNALYCLSQKWYKNNSAVIIFARNNFINVFLQIRDNYQLTSCIIFVHLFMLHGLEEWYRKYFIYFLSIFMHI